jgi:site-specific DNA recombinase
MTSVAIYVRISVDRDGRSESPERQEAACRELAARSGWTVARVYSDRDLSAYSTKVVRPEFEEMLRALKAGEIDGVVARAVDRLCRNRRDWWRLLELVEQGRELALVNEPFDTSTPMGRLVADLMASIARLESETISARVRSFTDAAARKGRPHSVGGRAWGYSAAWELLDDEAAEVRRVAERILGGESLGSITRDLNARGVRTGRDSEWTSANLGRAMRSPHLAGLRRHHEDLHVGEWEPVLDRETWERVRATLGRNKHRGGGGRRYLLTGVARCGKCGHGLSTLRTGKGVRRYACHPSSGRGGGDRTRVGGGCGRLGIIAEPLDALVSEGVLAALSGPGLARMLAAQKAGSTSTSERELAEAKVRLDELAADYADGRISRSEWMVARGTVADRVERVTRSLEADRSRPVIRALAGVDFESWWTAATDEERRQIITAVVSSVNVAPALRGGAGFDPRRVTVEWKA